jgi:signal-transduction protein with cAMP-binding, CBS, and nucleotidyltransferase domain
MEEAVSQNFINAIKAFISLSDPDLKEIASCCSVAEFKKNDFLLKTGQVCQYVYFINSGIVRHYYSTDQSEVTRWISMANEFTSSLQSFIARIPSRENLQSVTDCELVIINRMAFENLISDNQGFRNLWIKVLEFNYLTVEDRVFSLIEKSAEERFEWMIKNHPRFILRIPVMYTASMLGITPRHLSRLRKKYHI